jgi:hypothetical protein
MFSALSRPFLNAGAPVLYHVICGCKGGTETRVSSTCFGIRLSLSFQQSSIHFHSFITCPIQGDSEGKVSNVGGDSIRSL